MVTNSNDVYLFPQNGTMPLNGAGIVQYKVYYIQKHGRRSRIEKFVISY